MGQLERNRREMDATCEELDALLESDEANYDLFVDRLGQRRRQVADSCANSECCWYHEAYIRIIAFEHNDTCVCLYE